MENEYVIETRALTKKFPGKLAVDHVDMHIKKGDIYGFIGKNGAGKTTAMKLILGLLNPTFGEIDLFGNTDYVHGRKRIGSLIEAPGLYKNFSAYENMKRFSIIFGGTDKEIKEILTLVGLSDVGGRKVANYSLGMKQRLGIAVALLGNPEIMILDEPMNGLDPAGIKEIRDTILNLNKEKGVTFLISSHILDELAKIATTYGIINNGRLVDEIDAETLMKRCENKLVIKVSDTKKALTILEKEGYLENYKQEGDTITMFDHLDMPSVINEKLVNGGIGVYELAKSSSDFEDYFIERIGR